MDNKKLMEWRFAAESDNGAYGNVVLYLRRTRAWVLLLCLVFLPNGLAQTFKVDVGEEQGTDLNKASTVEIVRQGKLTTDVKRRVGPVFEAYPWFIETHWQSSSKQGAGTVTFQGIIDDAQAAGYFEREKKYQLNLSFKAMGLKPAYGLTKDKDRLRFEIRFRVRGIDNFEVTGGVLGIRSPKGGKWRTKTLPVKAVAAIIEALYTKEDPYTALIKGLPYG